MPYIQRDAFGRVMALYLAPPSEDAELLPATHPDVLQFMATDTAQLSAEDRRLLLTELDRPMIRVLEDLVDVLIKKRIIILTDLPEQAQKKILARKETRERLFYAAGDMPSGADDIFFPE